MSALGGVTPARSKAVIETAIRKAAKKPTGELTKADLEKVTKLNFSFERWTEVPKGLEKLTHLTSLNLMANRLTDVKRLEKLTKLKRLALSRNGLTEPPTGLEKLTQLESLSFFNNRLTNVKGLEKLTKLKWLVLLHNRLTRAQIDELQKALPKCKIESNPTK